MRYLLLILALALLPPATLFGQAPGAAPSGSPKPAAATLPGGPGEDQAVQAAPMKLITPQAEAATEFEKRTRFLVKKIEYHFFNKRFFTAGRFIQQLKEHDPENYLAYAYAGDIHLTHNELDKALENYQVALELSPEPARERFRIGQIYYLKGDPTRALAFFELALQNKPDFPLCHLYMGLVYLNLLQDKPKAIEYLSLYKSAAPGDQQIEQMLTVLKGETPSAPTGPAPGSPAGPPPATNPGPPK